MRKFLTLLIGSALLGAAPAAAAGPRLSPEAELAREIEGRVAGTPVDCVTLSRIRSSRIISRTAIVYDAGSTIYVNRPRGGAESLDHWDTLVIRPFGGRLCSVDTVDLYDSGSRMQTGFVSLGDFVPYRKLPQRR